MAVFKLLKLLCPKDQIIGSALVFWSLQGSLNLWLTNRGKQKPSSSVSCWNKLWSTVKANVFLQDQPDVETVPIFPLLWFLPYSCSTSFTHLPVIPENIFLINHLHANPHPQMGLRKTQHETRHFPNSSRRGIRFLLEDTRHTVMGKNTAVSGDGYLLRQLVSLFCSHTYQYSPFFLGTCHPLSTVWLPVVLLSPPHLLFLNKLFTILYCSFG